MGDIGQSVQAFTDFGKYLFDKLEKFGVFVFSPKGTTPESIEQFISRVKKLELPPLEEAALISHSRQIIKKYSRQLDILKIACEKLDGNSDNISKDKIDKLDEEWLSRFFDSAAHVSDDEIKIIWGNIFAQEILQPGSVTKRLISILSNISIKEAQDFSVISKYCLVSPTSVVPFIDFDRDILFWKQQGITYESLVNLDSIGLISFNDYGYNLHCEATQKLVQTFKYGNMNVEIESKSNTIDTGSALLTNCGMSLINAIDTEYKDEVINHIIEFLNSQEVSVTKTV